MQLMQVIDAHSQRQSPAWPIKKTTPVGTTSARPSVAEIIELTDSDDDLPVHGSPKMHHSQPGPSRSAPTTSSNAELTFGKPNSGLLVDGPQPSQHTARQEQQGDGEPLFLPGSDDEQHVIRPPPAHAARDAPDAALAHPQLPLPEPAQVAPQAPVPVDPIDEYLVRVLEIVPDVQPAHALALIEEFTQTQPGNVVEFVLHALFENPSYPKVDKNGKHKRDASDDDPNIRDPQKPKLDYTSKERVYNGGSHYFECSLEQLMMDFPRIPKPHIRSRLFDNRFYAPTYLLLADELKKEPLPFKFKSTNSVVGKGKGKARQDPEFDREREWILLKVAELATEKDAELAAAVNEQEYENNGQGIECGCCFSEYPFDQMIQCPEAHLFCKSCMSSYASNLLGEHNPNIVCMDQSGCKLPFPESELGRFLSPKLLELYYRVKQRKEIEAAGLENLEECPFCEYRCVIENELERLFRCENAACNAITCRACKKPPRPSCAIVQNARNVCYLFNRMHHPHLLFSAFIKEMGVSLDGLSGSAQYLGSHSIMLQCNKMTCPNCHTVSCYICRKIIIGYDHFSNPPPYSGKVDKLKCNLWDPVEQRHAEEVSEAAKRALAELRKSRPDVDESNLKVDIPVAQARPRPGPAQVHNGGAAWQAMLGAGAARLEGWGADIGRGAGVGGMAAGVGNPFMFGPGQAHPFAPPALGVPLRPGLLQPVAAIPDPVPAPLARLMAAGGGGRRRKGR
ncbi:hypothetical protein JVT61DRAFT_15103 [Boletus reticuloceps]|uniref:RING-type domain-containing protein n=1 Tax=Boletus reticuloceps TaxID=495285 RepID=A0A8I2YQS2_9AGAM|nr:hypothetical protein JVT61DRAFT_15103 [Boletus reticuloceps]